MPPIFSIDELITPVSSQQVKDAIYRVLETIGVQTSSWKSGAVVRTQIAASSLILSALSQVQSDIVRSGFVALSSGSWLTIVAKQVFGVERQAASFAAGTIKLINGGGGVFVLGPDDLIFVNPTTGKSYRNSGSVTLGAMSTVTIPIVATEAGSASSVVPGEITALQTTLVGVSCVNEVALVGVDEELDPSLREKCYEQLGALSPMGPWDAYTSALRNAKRADGTPLGITRIRLVKDGMGRIDVYVATASGVVGDPDIAIAAEAVARWATPEAVTAIVQSAKAHPIAVTCEVWLYDTSGYTSDEVEALIAQSLALFMSTQPLGGSGNPPGKVYVNSIRAAIEATLPAIFHVVVTSPAADQVLDVNRVPTLDGAPVASIHIEAAPASFGGMSVVH